MKLGEIGEDRLVGELLKGAPGGRGVVTGPGDDCAVLEGPRAGRHVLLKTDCVVEGVHYLAEHEAERVGWKALCRPLSDIAAHGGQPRAALVTIFSPPEKTVEYWKKFYRGLNKAARKYGVGIAGGETARAPMAAVSITVVGECAAKRVILRSGGKAGDRIFVTGRLGGSLRGRHLDFVPRLAEGEWLAKGGYASAMMDLSDGLAADLPRLARASGCGFRIEAEAVPRTRGATVEQALSDGEDYELLVAVPKRKSGGLAAEWKKRFPRVPLTEIGELTEKGTTPLPPGFDHFFHCQKAGKKAL